jgi:hypothetical protein
MLQPGERVRTTVTAAEAFPDDAIPPRLAPMLLTGTSVQLHERDGASDRREERRWLVHFDGRAHR